jgi:ribose-phosphate pyrophosphokinase
MSSLVLALPGNEALGQSLAGHLGVELGKAEFHQFPDGETHVQLLTAVKRRSIALVGTLAQPNKKIMPLLFTAATAKDLGAKRVGLVTPYLAYMRQDKRFNPGDGITSVYFAKLLSQWVDWLVTVDPHLHRRSSLDEIYSIPSTVVQAAPSIADWIKRTVEKPVMVGPDEESKQWVSTVAELADAPYLVLTKTRYSDRQVEVSSPDIERWRDRTPVLVDDIISTAQTMIETVKGLTKVGLGGPVCIGVHAVFAGTAYEDLLAAGASEVVTCNTIPHSSNGIDLAETLAEATKAFLGN